MSTTPDYGEPWKEKAYNYTVGDTGDVEGVIEIRTREELRVAYAWNPSDENEALFSRAIACVNACAGIADPAAEIQAMREALREAHEFIRDIVKNYECGERVDREGDAALAKLEPFIPDAPPPKP